MTYQKLIIVGNLGGDPEVRFTEQGVPVTTFSVATNRQYKRGEETVKETTWFRVTCWRRTAEVAADYLKKGREVMIEGRLTPDKDTGKPRIWTGNDGTPRASYEVTCARLILLSNRDGGQAQSNAPSGDGDIPF